MTSPPTGPQEGWYPDPEDPTHQRYWDGYAWTAHRTPLPPGASGYAAPSGTTWGAAPAGPQQTSDRATLALVLGILSLVMCGFFTGIPAMIIGRSATREIEQSSGRLGGAGIAQAGFVTGLIGTLLGVISLFFFVLFLGALFTSAGVST